MMEHTPWKLFRFSKLHHWKVDTGNPDWFVDCGFDEEVAHKVAAAPALLEACKEALRAIDQFEKVIEWEHHCPVYFIVEEAIAKATGNDDEMD